MTLPLSNVNFHLVSNSAPREKLRAVARSLTKTSAGFFHRLALRHIADFETASLLIERYHFAAMTPPRARSLVTWMDFCKRTNIGVCFSEAIRPNRPKLIGTLAKFTFGPGESFVHWSSRGTSEWVQKILATSDPENIGTSIRPAGVLQGRHLQRGSAN